MQSAVLAAGLLRLMRPLEWSKSVGNALIGALVAGYLLKGSAFNALALDWALLAAGFIGVALLWSGLYALNDYTDREHDARHSVKKLRPIPSGNVPANAALAFSLALLIAAFGLGYIVLLKTNSLLYLLCLAAMLVNQLLYTLKPFEFKKRAVIDLVSGSLVNPFFRFYAGWVLVLPAFSAPTDILAFVLCIQLGGFALYRLSGKEHEAKLGYKSSIVVFGERTVKALAYLGIGFAGLAYIYAALFGTLPLRFVMLAVLSALAAPLYLRALKDPRGMDIRKMHRIIYWHYILFIAGFVVLFAL